MDDASNGIPTPGLDAGWSNSLGDQSVSSGAKCGDHFR